MAGSCESFCDSPKSQVAHNLSSIFFRPFLFPGGWNVDVMAGAPEVILALRKSFVVGQKYRAVLSMECFHKVKSFKEVKLGGVSGHCW